MSIIDAIYGRRSVRKYTNEDVPKELVIKLIEAAIQAPSSSNLQPWSFAVIQNSDLLKIHSDQAKKLVLEKFGNSDDPRGYKKLLQSPDFNIFYNAGTLIIIYAKGQGLTSMGDCCLAGQNLMLAAFSHGMGTCWIGFATYLINSAEFKQQMGIPQDYRGVAPIIVGYPDVKLAKIPRNPMEILAWKD